MSNVTLIFTGTVTKVIHTPKGGVAAVVEVEDGGKYPSRAKVWVTDPAGQLQEDVTATFTCERLPYHEQYESSGKTYHNLVYNALSFTVEELDF